jgi:hypothetical protein
MRRYKKLVLVLISLASLGIAGLILTKIMQHAGEPFPGARVVLDDASWRMHDEIETTQGGYLWTMPNTVIYTEKCGEKWRIILRHLSAEGVASPPRTLPFLLTKNEYLDGLSPNGKILCLQEDWEGSGYAMRLVRTDGQGKPVRFQTEASKLHWSPDSRFLYGLSDDVSARFLERIDAHTGTIRKTLTNVPEMMKLTSITSGGNLLVYCNDGFPFVDSQMQKWRIGELQGDTVHSTTYQTPLPPYTLPHSLSPDGKLMLWWTESEENTLWMRIQKKILRKKIPPKLVHRFLITDADGTDARTIGTITEKMEATFASVLEWTPDSKGVHFVMDKKLWRLDVP